MFLGTIVLGAIVLDSGARDNGYVLGANVLEAILLGGSLEPLAFEELRQGRGFFPCRLGFRV